MHRASAESERLPIAVAHSLMKFLHSLVPALLLALAVASAPFARAAAPASAPAAPVTFRIHMIGDSTMADKPLEPAQPERGWGQLFPLYTRDPSRVVNYAMNGRSTKSFIDEGRWAKVLAALAPGDWVIIEFGHNDEKREKPAVFADAATTYRDNLRRFVREARAAGANPVLATPIVRRRFDAAGKIVDTHGDYPAALRAVAAEEKVPLLELHDRTHDLVASLGAEPSKKLYLWIAPGEYDSLPKGREDDTHLSAHGASRVSELAIAEIKRLKLPLAEALK